MSRRTSAGALDPAAAAAAVAALCPAASVVARGASEPAVHVPAAELVGLARAARDHAGLRFDSLLDLSGEDLCRFPGEAKGTYPSDKLVVVYALHSQTHFHRATLKVEVPRDAAEVPTVVGVWPVAGLWEREVFDLFGVVFTGHPDLRRILTPDDWAGHPLRKDYVYPTAYHGVPLRRDGQEFEDGPYA
jgi:NADH-quinone oxidoreductase subunit C